MIARFEGPAPVVLFVDLEGDDVDSWIVPSRSGLRATMYARDSGGGPALVITGSLTAIRGLAALAADLSADRKRERAAVELQHPPEENPHDRI